MKTVITTKWVRLQSATQCRLSYRKSEIKDDDLNGGSVKFKSFQRILPATSFVSNNPFKTKGLSLSKFYRGNEPELSSLHLSKRHAHSISPFDLGTVSQTIIKKFLRSKYINFSEDKGCIILQLPEHLLTGNEMKISWDEVEESVAPVYINKVTGTFIAPDSAIGGDWIGLQEFITAWMKWKQTKKSSMNDDFPVFKSIIPGKEDEIAGISEWNEATPVHEMDPVEFKAVLKTLRITVKALKQEDFAEFGARILQSTSEIENHSNVQLLFPVRYIDGCLIGFRRIFICPHDGSVKEESIINQQGSLNPNNCNIHPFPHGLDQAYRFKASSIILVPSILDSITLWTKSPPGKVFPVTLANGITSFAPDHLPFYKDFKIVFWFADTLASFEAIKAFSEKLGQDRCSTMSRDIPQPSLAIKSHNIKDIVPFISQNSKDCSHEFIKMFESLREDVYIEFLNADEVKGVEWKRFTHLNDLLSGFRRGELTVFSGRTGKGKTTFISEYSLDLCMQNVSTLWGSFEVKPTRLAKMQLKQFSGIHLEDNLDSFDKWANLFQKLPMYYLMFHGSQEIEKVLDAMAHAVYLYDIAHVIIDNMQFMMGSDKSALDRYYAQDQIIGKFRKFATLHNVHVTLVIHPRKEDSEIPLTTSSIFGGAKATQEADNVLLLQEESVGPKLKRKYVEVAKNRFSGDLGQVPLFFCKSTSTFSKKIYANEKKSAKKVQKSVETILEAQEQSIDEDSKSE